jgi:hypothetical protein
MMSVHAKMKLIKHAVCVGLGIGGEARSDTQKETERRLKLVWAVSQNHDCCPAAEVCTFLFLKTYIGTGELRPGFDKDDMRLPITQPAGIRSFLLHLLFNWRPPGMCIAQQGCGFVAYRHVLTTF